MSNHDDAVIDLNVGEDETVANEFAVDIEAPNDANANRQV